MMGSRRSARKFFNDRRFCDECLKGDIASCGQCLKNVCVETNCGIETPSHFCQECQEYWCDDCLQEAKYCCYCDVDHCPRCDIVETCLVCEAKGDGVDACVLCCQKHKWTRVGYGWACDVHDDNDDNDAQSFNFGDDIVSDVYVMVPLITPNVSPMDIC